MNNPTRSPRMVVKPETLVMAALAVAVLSVVALGTVVIAMRLRDSAEASLPGDAPTMTGTPLPPTAVIGEVPQPSAAPSGQEVIHVVKPGETLIGIAAQYNIPPDLIESANHLKNPGMIFPGEQLVIPNTIILTPVIPLGTQPPAATPTLSTEDPANLSMLSGWPRSLADGTQQDLDANYPLVVERPRFRLHYQPGTYPASHVDEVVARIERALSNVEARLGVHLDGTFDAYAAGTLFVGSDAHLRGQSRSPDRRLFFLSDGTGTPAENDYVVTHELTHLVSWNTWGSPTSTMLSEGLATYIGKTELEAGGFMPYSQLCLGIMAAGQLPPLAVMDRDPSYFQGHIENRFNYFGSACFVQYLVETYGLQTMSKLYHSSEYMTLYGKSLPDLDQEWRLDLQGHQSEMTIDPAILVSATQEVTQAYEYVFRNINDTATMHQAYLAIDQARIALWKGDYTSTHLWLSRVYQLTGLTPQPGSSP